jgi:hypothetical protein
MSGFVKERRMNKLRMFYYYLNRRVQDFFDPDKKSPGGYIVMGTFCLSALIIGILRGWEIGGVGGAVVLAAFGIVLGWCVAKVAILLLKNLMVCLVVFLGFAGYLGFIYLFNLLWGLGR